MRWGNLPLDGNFSTAENIPHSALVTREQAVIGLPEDTAKASVPESGTSTAPPSQILHGIPITPSQPRHTMVSP